MLCAEDGSRAVPTAQVWVGLKSYLCCDLLNSVGSTWTSLIVTASFGLALLIAAFIWIGRCAPLEWRCSP